MIQRTIEAEESIQENIRAETERRESFSRFEDERLERKMFFDEFLGSLGANIDKKKEKIIIASTPTNKNNMFDEFISKYNNYEKELENSMLEKKIRENQLYKNEILQFDNEENETIENLINSFNNLVEKITYNYLTFYKQKIGRNLREILFREKQLIVRKIISQFMEQGIKKEYNKDIDFYCKNEEIDSVNRKVIIELSTDFAIFNLYSNINYVYAPITNSLSSINDNYINKALKNVEELELYNFGVETTIINEKTFSVNNNVDASVYPDKKLYFENNLLFLKPEEYVDFNINRENYTLAEKIHSCILSNKEFFVSLMKLHLNSDELLNLIYMYKTYIKQLSNQKNRSNSIESVLKNVNKSLMLILENYLKS